MTHETMTTLAPDNKYTRFLKEKFNIRDEQILKAEMGKVRCYQRGKAQMVNMLVIELKGSSTEQIYHIQGDLARTFFRNSGTLVNIQYFERHRPGNDAINPQMDLPFADPLPR